ncbi:MAG: tRNA lysidine(34) synthetase TilS [Planctomycetota bacterium]
MPDDRRHTLVAASGGADSTALALALAATGRLAGLAHVVHDLRPRRAALADRDAVEDLAGVLGVPFFEAGVRVKRLGGNAEAAARRLRYGALERIARREGIPFIATGHQADDQLETVLMRLMRGTGVAGLRGVAPRRRLASGIMLVRPCLTITRADCESLCSFAGIRWRVDATNADTRLTRAALRSRVLPVLRELWPTGSTKAAALALDAREIHRLTQRYAASLLDAAKLSSRPLILERDPLRSSDRLIVVHALRLAAKSVLGKQHHDHLTRAGAARLITAIRDGRGHTRTLLWSKLKITVTRDDVILTRARAASIVRR